MTIFICSKLSARILSLLTLIWIILNFLGIVAYFTVNIENRAG